MASPHGFPQPRHSYIHVPQPGRRGVLVHNGQIPNGAAPSNITPGGYFQGGYVGGPAGMVQGAHVGGVVAGGYTPGVLSMPNYHSRPLYYGSNVPVSTYAAGYNYPTYSYHSPYATYGLGIGMYANYYHPYQRSYYYPATIATPAVPVACQPVATATCVPAQTAYTVTNSHVPAVATTTTTRTTTVPRATTVPPVMQSPGPIRTDIQTENRRIATERGAYNIRNIKPVDALPDDPFWCMERTGEWHLRTFYQIENECYPGRWHMNPDQGFLVFHRA